MISSIKNILQIKKTIFLNSDRFVNAKETTHLSASLSILVCLCKENFFVKKFILSMLTDEDRKNLFAKCLQDQKLSVRNLHSFLIVFESN